MNTPDITKKLKVRYFFFLINLIINIINEILTDELLNDYNEYSNKNKGVNMEEENKDEKIVLTEKPLQPVKEEEIQQILIEVLSPTGRLSQKAIDKIIDIMDNPLATKITDIVSDYLKNKHESKAMQHKEKEMEHEESMASIQSERESTQASTKQRPYIMLGTAVFFLAVMSILLLTNNAGLFKDLLIGLVTLIGGGGGSIIILSKYYDFSKKKRR